MYLFKKYTSSMYVFWITPQWLFALIIIVIIIIVIIMRPMPLEFVLY